VFTARLCKQAGSAGSNATFGGYRPSPAAEIEGQSVVRGTKLCDDGRGSVRRIGLAFIKREDTTTATKINITSHHTK